MANSGHKYFNQVYKSIKMECIRGNKLFKDDKFPNIDKSLTVISNKSRANSIKWMRAKDLCTSAQLIVDDLKKQDLENQTFGNYGLLNAIGIIGEKQENRMRIIPDDQSFTKDYCGAFHFRIWHKGGWIDIVVDDYLPVDSNYNLIYIKNKRNKNEFWQALLEKAYAKLHSCYAMIKKIKIEHCLVDLTGGVCETVDLNRLIKEQKSLETIKHNSNMIIKLMLRAKLNGAVSFASKLKPSETKKYQKPNEHCFMINEIYEKDSIIKFSTDDLENLTGWEESSLSWAQFKNEQPAENEQAVEPFKSIIMFQEFFEVYNSLHIVHMNLNFMKFASRSTNKQPRWDFKQITGKWTVTKNLTKNNEINLYTMPQHTINLNKTEDIERSMIISLMTLDYKERRMQHKSMAPISFHLFRLVGKKSQSLSGFTFTRQNFNSKDLKRVGRSSDKFISEREICKRFIVNQGAYVIVPSIINLSTETNYLLRVYIENVKRINDDSDDEEDDEFEFEEEDGEKDEPEEFTLIDNNELEDSESDESSDEEETKKKKPKRVRTRKYSTIRKKSIIRS